MMKLSYVRAYLSGGCLSAVICAVSVNSSMKRPASTKETSDSFAVCSQNRSHCLKYVCDMRQTSVGLVQLKKALLRLKRLVKIENIVPHVRTYP